MARRVAAQAHADLLVLERTINEKTGKLRQDIQVDDVRRTVSFFGSTAGEGGWRVAIVDAVDELNAAGANALLKVLEEPPRRALLLLVSHSPARGAADHPLALPACCRCGRSPTTTSRAPRPPRSGEGPDDRRRQGRRRDRRGQRGPRAGAARGDALAACASGSTALLEQLPAVDPRALHALGDRLAGTDPAPLAAFVDTVNDWLSARLAGGRQDRGRMARRGRGLGQGQRRGA